MRKRKSAPIEAKKVQQTGAARGGAGGEGRRGRERGSREEWGG
jgi:hypothetical protein